MFKKILCFAASVGIIAALNGCGAGNTGNGGTNGGNNGASPSPSGGGAITVISREPGSGTRTAFIELAKVEEKDSAGNKTDKTVSSAITVNQTEAVLSQVAGNPAAIGYVSSGSLNDTVKAVAVDGVEAAAANVKSGAYKISRPFIIMAKTEAVTGLVEDFINYTLAKEGQAVVDKNKYVKVSEGEGAAFESTKLSGKIVVGGSSSVSPLMEKLIEDYKKINPNATIDLQTTDSGTGIKNAKSGAYDIGMSSRELTSDEKNGLAEKSIAVDGIAVVINKANKTVGLKLDDITKIFTGEVSNWDEIK
jgi:phosphate transport system substrate-binding protein